MNSNRRLNSRQTVSWQGMEQLEDRLLLTANILVFPEYVGTYAADGTTFLGKLDFNNPANRDPSYIHRFDIKVQSNDMAAGQDFMGMAFDVNLGSHLTIAGPYEPVNTISFIDNLDTGAADLKAIMLHATRQVCNSQQFGEAQPTTVGSISLKWDGVDTMLTLSPNPPGGSAWLTWDNNSTDSGTLVAQHGNFSTAAYGFLGTVDRMITITNTSADEGPSPKNLNFVVSLSSASPDDVTFRFKTADGTATAGADYTAVDQTYTIPAGQTSLTVSVPIINDTLAENNESVLASITEVSTNVTVDNNQATGLIYDDGDPDPTVRIGNVSVTEGNSGTTSADFTVTLSAASGKTITVDYATASGTATSGTDFQPASGTLTFNPGETTKTVSVLVNGDTTAEATERFTVTLNNPTGTTVVVGTGTGTIVNDDIPAPDSFEPDNTPQTASTLTIGVPQAHTISAANDVDWAKFTLNSASTVTLTTSGSFGDTRMWLYSQSDTTTPIASNDNSNGTKFSQITQALVPGNYCVKIDDGGTDTALAVYNLSLTTVDLGHVVFTGKTRAAFTDAHGVHVQVYLSGPGTGEVWMPTGGVGDPLQISTTGTTGKSTLTILTLDKGKTITLPDVLITGSIGSVIGKTSILGGNLTVTGGMKKLQMLDTAGVHTLSVGAPELPKDLLAVTLGQVHDFSVSSLMPLSSLAVTGWANSTGVTTSIHAPYINKLTSGTGNFQADVTLTGTGTTKAALGSATIGASATGDWDITGNSGKIAVTGLLNGSIIHATGSITSMAVGGMTGSQVQAGSSGSITVTGQLNTSTIHATGNITSVTVGSMTDSQVQAGTAGKITIKGLLDGSTIRSAGNISSVAVGGVTDSQVLAGIVDSKTVPTAAADFTSAATIGSVKVTGWKVGKGQVLPPLVKNAKFAAAKILTVSLLNPDNRFSDIGVYVKNDTLPSIKSLTWKDLADPTQNYTWKTGNGAPPSVIHII